MCGLQVEALDLAAHPPKFSSKVSKDAFEGLELVKRVKLSLYLWWIVIAALLLSHDLE